MITILIIMIVRKKTRTVAMRPFQDSIPFGTFVSPSFVSRLPSPDIIPRSITGKKFKFSFEHPSPPSPPHPSPPTSPIIATSGGKRLCMHRQRHFLCPISFLQSEYIHSIESTNDLIRFFCNSISTFFCKKKDSSVFTC